MSELINSMQSALELAGGSPGLTALFLAGLIALWNQKFRGDQQNGNLFWYGAIALFVVVSPFFLMLVSEFLPELTTDHMMLWILPVAPVILITGVNAFSFQRTKKERILFLTAFLAIMFLAGTTAYTRNQYKIIENAEYIPDSELEMILKVEEYRQQNGMETVLLWAPQDIMNYARVYSGNIYLLYGKDLWLGSMDSQMHQIYEEWQREAYIYMENAPLYLEKIAEVADTRGCDVLIFSREVFDMYETKLPEYLGEGQYVNDESGRDYILYVRSQNVYPASDAARVRKGSAYE
ncbi:MAG: hypothetical protein K2J95_10200 [Lachnospiraceae bacterium]|nr:hypothetical protein [Lachnospiraceae bacterium]